MMRLTMAFAALLALAACSGVHDFVRGYGRAPASALAAYDLSTMERSARGGVLLALGDFGALDTDALETHAVPWRLAGAALVLAEAEASGAAVSRATLDRVLARFGFLSPQRIENWPEGVTAPALEGPLGLSVGVIRRAIPRVELTVANLGCASCHAGVAYGADGAPQPDVAWLGAPNTSLDLEAYVQAVYRAFAGADEAALLAAIPQVFPDVSEAEMATMKSFVLPRVKKRMAAIAAAGGGALPFVNGAPGLTNGVAALKMQLGVLGPDAHARERGFTAIPDLSSRGWRTSLLYDGAYAPAGFGGDRPITRADITDAHLDGLATVTAFFTVPSMGVHPDRARAYLGEAKDVFRFFAAYAPPRFPGRIDGAKAARGRDVYATACAQCHGVYDASVERPALQSFPNHMAAYDTDPARAQTFTSAVADAVRQSAYGRLLVARATGQYAAPPLSGLWMSAPYLHNGSVPTLRALLDPATRPARFLAGGHRLDMAAVGIALRPGPDGVNVYPEGHTPFAAPQLIDTTALGLSNRGHTSEVEDLSARDRDALLEYLKLL